MNSKLWKWIAVAVGTALGLGMMALQKQILLEGFDEAGLLLMNNPGLWVMWGVTALCLAGAAVLAWNLGEGGSFEDSFPACLYSGMTAVIAGFVMLFTGISGLGDQWLIALCALVLGVGMVMGGICRCCGWKPDWWMDLMIFFGYLVMLVWSYRGWNVEPTRQTYAYQLLGIVCAMLFALHRARWPWDYPDRRRMIFFGLVGLTLSFPAMVGAEESGFFFATAVWCAGGLCEMTKQQPAEPEEAPREEMPESEPDAAEEAETDPVQAMLEALEREKKTEE